MLSQGNNVLDLLLGIRPQSGQTSQTTGNAAGATDQSFPDIFDLLFGGEKPQVGTGENSGSGTPIDLMGILSSRVQDGEAMSQLQSVRQGSETAQNTTLEELPGDVTGKESQTAKPDFSLLFGLGEISEFGFSNPLGTVTADDVEPITPDVANAKQVSNLAELMPSHGMIAGQNVRNLLNGKPVEIETGDYRVVDVQITDKQVILRVEPENDPGSRIKMTLPLEQVTELAGSMNSPRVADASWTAGQLSRVKLSENDRADAAKIEKLLSRLNLKELQITKANTAPAESGGQQTVAADEIVNVKITATRSGEEVALKMNMKAGELHAVKQPEAAQVVASNADVSPTEEGIIPNKATSETPSTIEKTNDELLAQEVDLESSAKQSRTDKLSDAGNSGIGKPEQAHPGSFFDRVSGTRTSLEQQTTTPPARFTLPDNLAAALKTNSRSVMISVEPDHLGPARLHLAMHNDALTARLTVDSIHAKAAVESSLDQLTDQLARAGVKVHHVEVSVSGGDVGSNLFERRPVWNGKTKSAVPSMDRLFDANTTTSTPTASDRSAGYVRADGVNVFA